MPVRVTEQDACLQDIYGARREAFQDDRICQRRIVLASVSGRTHEESVLPGPVAGSRRTRGPGQVRLRAGGRGLIGG